MAVYEMVGEEGPLPRRDKTARIEAKQVKIEHFLKYSADCGTVDGDGLRVMEGR